MTTLRDIQGTVARHYGVSVAELKSARQTKGIVWPRHVAMHICRSLTGHSLPGIGRAFGDRNHSTVVKGIERVERRMAECPATAKEVAGLRWAIVRANGGADAPKLTDPEMLDRLRALLNSRHAAERQLAGLEREIKDLLVSAGWQKQPPVQAESGGGPGQGSAVEIAGSAAPPA